MCNNIVIIYIFMILKVVAVVILPIVIIIKRKEKKIYPVIILDVILLAFFIICNIFNINSCVYNSNFGGIKRVRNENKITLYNSIHPQTDKYYSSDGINANRNLRTFNNTSLYYYNQNKPYMNNAYYKCGNNKIYMNSFGSSITSFSIVLSTLYQNEINPVQLFDIYKSENENLCTNKMDIMSIYNTLKKLYEGITLEEISSNDIYNGLKSGGYIIVELSSNEKSKLTCDNGYIVIYNITKDSKYVIADPSIKDSPYVCSYSSAAYGNIINSNNMEKSWTIEDIENEAVRYYLVKKV